MVQNFQLPLFSSFLGSGPGRGQSPVEWEEIPSVRSSICLSVRSSPLGPPSLLEGLESPLSLDSLLGGLDRFLRGLESALRGLESPLRCLEISLRGLESPLEGLESRVQSRLG